MVPKIIVVGIGPGDPDFVIPAATKAMKSADVLVGSKRALEVFAEAGQKTLEITGKLGLLETQIRELKQVKSIVVLVSGDPGYYSLLTWLKKLFSDWDISVIPGLSSIQVAFSRLAEVWQDADLLSFHGRVPAQDKLNYVPGKKLAFLTDKEHNPGYICQVLLDCGWPSETRVAMLERISYSDEKIREGTLLECKDEVGFYHSVLVVRE